MMHRLRSKPVARLFSAFFLLSFAQSIFLPLHTFALTSGPTQPEFTSYEDAGAKDMVNLLTGDMTFNLPILEVPGPEGGFSMPLSYHAGIGLEQEGSWCGLGFNMNAGSIVRSVNQYPDDASGEINGVTVQNLTGVNGWSRKYNHPFQDDWNSQTGYHGNINLLDIIEVDFGNQTNVGIVGVHVGDEGVSFNAMQFISSVISIASWGTAGSITAAAKQAAVGLAASTAISFAMPTNTPGAGTMGAWQSSKSTHTTFENDNRATLINSAIALAPVPVYSKKKSYHIWLDQTRNERMYGSLYLGKPPLQNYNLPYYKSFINGQSVPLNAISHADNVTGSASDINFVIDGNQEYYTQNTPTVVATDDYVVNAPGVSGSISPYRLDVGFVSMPRQMGTNHYRMAPMPYLDYKVPFVYDGQQGNTYYHHVGNSPSDQSGPASPGFYYGIEFDDTCLNPELPDCYYEGYASFNDWTFNNQRRIRSDLNDRKKVPQGNAVEWLSNGEIRNSLSASSQTCPAGFIDFLSGAGTDYTKSDRYKFRSNYTVGDVTGGVYNVSVSSYNNTIPITNTTLYNSLDVGDKIILRLVTSTDEVELPMLIQGKSNGGINVSYHTSTAPFLFAKVDVSVFYFTQTRLQDIIGGYRITSADGTIYHFALPVYNYNEQTVSVNVNDSNIKSIIDKRSPFATTWLLTAITGADFIDRNANGLADEEDWGYWVKMNYGRYTDSFDWRIPYGVNTYTLDASGVFKSYQNGQREVYYLNSVETRSHVALFMKGVRQDGKNASGTIAPLRLEEISLLTRENYKKLLTPTYGSHTDYANKLTALCMSSDFSAANVRNFINGNCVKRIVLNFGYDLCKNTPNAGGVNNPNQAKLTLNSISVFGRNNLKVVPDYKFTYDYNPDYDVNKWDGWGLYSSSGTSSHNSHTTTDANSGVAWSMNKITTPLGGEIVFNYERDNYSTVSGEPAEKTLGSYSTGTGTFAYAGVGTGSSLFATLLNVSNADKLAKDDRLRVSGSFWFHCSTTNTRQEYIGEVTVTNVQGSTVTLLGPVTTLNIQPCQPVTSSTSVTIDGGTGTFIQQYNKLGGNLRVHSIVTNDEFGRQQKIRYLYEVSAGMSSGVVSQEPGYISAKEYSFSKRIRYPQTPVMYSAVSVLSGPLTTDADYYSKQVFEFETPSQSMLTVVDENHTTTHPSSSSVDQHLYKIEDRTSRIGKLKAVRVYGNGSSMPVSEAVLTYTDQLVNNAGVSSQGIYSEGTLQFDVLLGVRAKLNRTTVLNYPWSMKKITNTKDGFSSSTEYLKWDLITGNVTETLNKSPLGIYTKTVTIPAYKEPGYESMGSKATMEGNKNMLSQVAETYVYRSNVLGSSLGLLGASAQKWSQVSNYRYLSGGVYVDSPDETVSAANPVWRKSEAYVWKGNSSLLQDDGTFNFSETDKFNFSNSNNPLWQYIGRTTRYDHYSMPLQSEDMNGIASSVKMGYDNRTVIAQAVNARYDEIAFSSAEDEIPGTGFFSGEVAIKAPGSTATVVRKSAGTLANPHTGDCALSVAPSSYGFVFKPRNLVQRRRYIVTVWTNSQANGRIYYKLNGANEVLTTTSTTLPQGKSGWYKVERTIDIPADVPFTSLEVGVKSVSATVLFDDFRFQPMDAAMTCYVYNPLDYEFTGPDYSDNSYVLNNDNFYTRYEASPDGATTRVYVESAKFQGEKLVSESKTDFRRLHVNP